MRGDPRPELSPEVEITLSPEARGRIDEVVERLRRRAEARRGPGKRRAQPTATAGSSPDPFPKVPGFEITDLLDEGGFGRVYRAISRRHFGVPVALKILRTTSPPEAGPGAAERRLLMTRLLIGEAKVLAYIGHRNVVRYPGSGIVEGGPEAGTPFIATELIDGPSLARRIGRAPQHPAWSARILAQVADALDFVHQLKLQRSMDGDDEDPGPGILHRDVKPSNILLGRGDQPILTDFGLAGRVGRSASDEGFIAGTTAYSAPEQLRADAVLTPAADVYGLGATLYHLLTGTPPRREPTPGRRWRTKAGLRLIPPRRLAPRIPADLERICLKCLEEDPARRYQAAGEVRDELKRFLDGKPIVIHPVGPVGRAVRWARHRRLAAALAASLVPTLSIGLLATAWLWLRAEAERARADSERREAEADFELANEIVEGFVESISIGYFDPAPTASLESGLIPLLRRGRQQLLALAHRHPHHVAAHKRLASTDNRLAEFLIKRGGRDEPRRLLAEAQESLDRVIAEAPADPAVLNCQADIHRIHFMLAAAEGMVEEVVEHQERVLAVLERLWDLEPTKALCIDLADRRSDLAVWLERRGGEARARALIEANVRLLADDPRGESDPGMALRRVFAHEDLRQLGTSERSGRTASRAAPGMDALPRLISPEADDLDPDEWASALIEVLSMSPTPGVATPGLEPDRIGSFVHRTASRAAARRHTGRLDQAGRIADRLHAFARRLVARYPDQPTAHWALSQAYVQLSKNAWQTPDRSAVERYLRLAVNAAAHALVLDPDNAAVQRHLADWQKRLDDLVSATNPADASNPPQRPGTGD